MKSILSFSSIVCLLLFTSCTKYSIRGEGSCRTDTRYISYIDAVEADDAVDVDIIPSNTDKVEVSGYENLVDNFESYVSNGTLKLKFRAFYNVRNNNVHVKVYTKSLHSISLNGSGNLNMWTGMELDDLSVDVNGSGDIRLDENYAHALHCKVNGSGNIDARFCVADDVYAKISGSGNIDATANDFLDATISGSGDINYWGDPETVNVNVSGSGKVHKK